ncbi:hypothetical protein FB451DRAFT_1178342 [Mycena latifolia]|nr:hypothetical protein FB451DRAFT_1178342 [Mycena latifolia]
MPGQCGIGGGATEGKRSDSTPSSGRRTCVVAGALEPKRSAPPRTSAGAPAELRCRAPNYATCPARRNSEGRDVLLALRAERGGHLPLRAAPRRKYLAHHSRPMIKRLSRGDRKGVKKESRDLIPCTATYRDKQYFDVLLCSTRGHEPDRTALAIHTAPTQLFVAMNHKAKIEATACHTSDALRYSACPRRISLRTFFKLAFKLASLALGVDGKIIPHLRRFCVALLYTIRRVLSVGGGSVQKAGKQASAPADPDGRHLGAQTECTDKARGGAAAAGRGGGRSRLSSATRRAWSGPFPTFEARSLGAASHVPMFTAMGIVAPARQGGGEHAAVYVQSRKSLPFSSTAFPRSLQYCSAWALSALRPQLKTRTVEVRRDEGIPPPLFLSRNPLESQCRKLGSGQHRVSRHPQERTCIPAKQTCPSSFRAHHEGRTAAPPLQRFRSLKWRGTMRRELHEHREDTCSIRAGKHRLLVIMGMFLGSRGDSGALSPTTSISTGGDEGDCAPEGRLNGGFKLPEPYAVGSPPAAPCRRSRGRQQKIYEVVKLHGDCGQRTTSERSNIANL